MRGIVLVGALLIAGCDEIPHAWSRQEIIDIARANADRPDSSDLARRVGSLEAEVARLRQEQASNASLTARITDTQAERIRYEDDSFSRLFANDETFRLNVNALRGVQGWAPIAKAEKK